MTLSQKMLLALLLTTVSFLALASSNAFASTNDPFGITITSAEQGTANGPDDDTGKDGNGSGDNSDHSGGQGAGDEDYGDWGGADPNDPDDGTDDDFTWVPPGAGETGITSVHHAQIRKGAPDQVRAAVFAANKIARKPYVWGGGHDKWTARGYDCSGAVSFALHGGGLIGSPLASGGLKKWGQRGKGKWITVYTNSNHAFMVIDGMRFDTSGQGGKGPRWRMELMRSTRGFVARHPAGF